MTDDEGEGQTGETGKHDEGGGERRDGEKKKRGEKGQVKGGNYVGEEDGIVDDGGVVFETMVVMM